MSHHDDRRLGLLVDDDDDDLLGLGDTNVDEDEGTLVETPTRCNNTKNNREERVRISSAIRTGVAGKGGGLR